MAVVMHLGLESACLCLTVTCLQARYPVLPQQQRRQQAVWRGSNTDTNVLLMDERNVMQVTRTRLHMYGLWYPDIMDAHYTAFSQQAFDTHCIEELIPPGEHYAPWRCGGGVRVWVLIAVLTL